MNQENNHLGATEQDYDNTGVMLVFDASVKEVQESGGSFRKIFERKLREAIDNTNG